MLNVLFFTPLVLFFAAVVLEFCGMLFRKDQVARIAWWLFLAGSGCLSAYLVARGITAGRIPLSNQFEFATAFAWGVAVMLIVLQKRTQAQWIRAAAMPMAFLILSYAALQPREITELMPALKSAWFGLHIGSAVFSYASFVLAGCAGILICCSMTRKPGLIRRRITGSSWWMCLLTIFCKRRLWSARRKKESSRSVQLLLFAWWQRRWGCPWKIFISALSWLASWISWG